MAKKRGAGEGNVYQRSDGRWEARISLGWANGKRIRKSYFGATQAAVEAELLKARTAQAQGLPVVIERQTVEEYMTDWLEITLKPRAKARSFESFSTIARLHIFPMLGRIQLSKLTPQAIQRLLAEKSKPVKDEQGDVKTRRLSPQTIGNIRTVMRSAFAQAVKFNLITRNPAALVDVPRIPRKQVATFTCEQARQFLDKAAGERYEAIFVLAITLGMRRGEILGLRWCDVNLETRTLRINQSLQRLRTDSEERGKKSELIATETKTDGSRRSLALPDSVVRTLKSHKARQAQQQLAAGAEWRNATGLVFTNASGRPIEPILLHRDFKALLEKAGLPVTMKFHSLRHSAASLLLSQGVSPRVIMELLGHSSISVTMNVYAHVMPTMMREAADSMDRLLGNA